MKRQNVLFLIIILLPLAFLSATVGGPETADISLPLANITGSASVSFSEESTNLVAAVSSDSQLTGSGSVFLKWNVVSSASAGIYLSANGPLRVSEESEGLDWQPEIDTVSQDSAMSKPVNLSFESWNYGEKKILSYAPATDGVGDRGSVKVTITAEDASSAKPGVYNATLIATLKTI